MSESDAGWIFPSVEWVQALAERLNSLPEYRDSSEGWKGPLALVALAEDGKLPRDVAIGLDPTGGTISDVYEVADYKNADVPYVLSARYSVWKDVIQGKHDILSGVMRGKIRLRGNLFKLMLQLKTPEIMLREMRALRTRFYDETASERS